MELVQRRTNGERNEVSGAQQSYEIYETENEESAWDIKTITDQFPAIRSGLDRTQNVTIVEDKTKSKLADYDITPTRRPDTNQLTRMNKDKDKIPKILPDTRSKGKESKDVGQYEFDRGRNTFGGEQLDEFERRIHFKPKRFPSQFLDSDSIDEAVQNFKMGLKGCIIKFSKENFIQLHSKVLSRANTRECNKCRLDTLLPVHSSQHGRCPLGQMKCSCVSPDGKRPCPSNFCDVMYDEIIKQHRTSLDLWLASLNKTNWHQNHWEITKFFISDRTIIRKCGRIKDLECVDFLNIMVNNLAFQKKISCQIDPPSDVVSKIRSYLRNEVYTTDDDMFKDVLHNMITILTSFINQMTSTRIAIHKLQQLERRYDEEHIFTRRGFQNKSDKLKASIKKRQPSFAYDQEKIERFPRKSIEGDVREKKYDDTIKKPAYYDQTPTRRPDTNQLTRMDKDKIPKVLLETRSEGKETKDFGQYELDRAYYDKTPTRCPDTNQLTKMKMDKDKIPKILLETRSERKETKDFGQYEFYRGRNTYAGEQLDMLHQRIHFKRKRKFLVNALGVEAVRYLEKGLQGCVIKFSKENFYHLRFKVLNKSNTRECNKCRLDTLLPVHSSQHGRCPLGQMKCNCISPLGRKPCPSNFCDVMYDEIIKQHRTSSDRWLASKNKTNWHQNHWEITKFFISNQSLIRKRGRTGDLQCVDLLDIMVNNLAFQKEMYCQIKPPFDVVSKIRLYLKTEVHTADDDMFQDVVHNMITILASIINQMPNTHKAVQDLQELERRYDEEQTYPRRGFQNESEKLKESLKKRQAFFAGYEGEMEWFPRKSIEVDVREKQYEDTMKKTCTHDKDISFERDDQILLPKDEFERVLIEAETSCRIMAENKTNITESKLLILQDKIECLIQASGTSAATSFQRQDLDSVIERFLNIKKMFLSEVAFRDMEYQIKKRDFKRGMHFGYHRLMGASLNPLDRLYLYSHDGERIRSEKDIFYQRGSLSKNIVVSGSKSSCEKLCVFLEENCTRHAHWPVNEFEYVFRLPLRYIKETHIHDMIKSHIFTRSNDAEIFEQVLFREADKCFIILEELDKWIPYEYDELDMKNRQLSTAQRNVQLPKRNHMTDYVVLVTTEDKNVKNIKLGETDGLLYLKGSDSDSDLDSDTFNKLVSQGEKNVQLDRDSIPGHSKYCSAVFPTEPFSDSF